MITIKKYRNRRLYNTNSSRYVNLEDVAELVRDGETLEVIDVTTGDDITRLILTQIIMEGAKDSEQEMPIEFLRQIIASSGRARNELITKYSSFITGIYQRAQEEIRERFQTGETTDPGAPRNAFEAFQRFVQPGGLDQILRPFHRERRDFQREDEEQDQNQATHTSDPSSELVAMRRRLEELEQLMKQTVASGTVAHDSTDSAKEN